MAATGTAVRRHVTWSQTYGERAEQCNLTPLATYLLRLIHVKRTNLCVSADVFTTAELLRLAEDVGDYICVLKTHADIVTDFGDRTIRGLTQIARRKKFLLFEDRKFGDIGNTVQHQYSGGPLQIVRWAQIVNAHLFPGPTIISALSQSAHDAIVRHNTSVSTDISASPRVRATGALPEDVESDSDDDFDHDLDAPPSQSEGEEENEEDEDEDEEEEESIADRRVRKQSVVSVTTTIDTQTEAMSPPPSLRPSLSRGASAEDHLSLSNEEKFQGLEDLGPPPFYRSLLLFAQMSSAGNMFTAEYTQTCVEQARANRDFVMGFIAQRSLNSEPGDNFITMTPGVQLSAGGDSLGQQYNTPRMVIGEMGNDIAIVGRGILSAPDRRRAAEEYSKETWAAYEDRVRSSRRSTTK